MISSAQLRAARGLLDWTRSDLSKSSGVSVETIKNIERNVYMPQETTVNAIVNAFAEHDVEFTEDDGVRSRKNRVLSFSGKKGYIAFVDYIYSSLKDHGGIIRQFNLSDGTHLPYAEEYGAIHLDRMKKIKPLDAKVLTEKGDYAFPATYCDYRWLHVDSKQLIPFYLFNNNVCLIIHKTTTEFEAIVFTSTQLSERFVDYFDTMWKASIAPDKLGDALE